MKNVSRPGLDRVRNFIKDIDNKVGTPLFIYDIQSMKDASGLFISSAEKAGLEDYGFYLAFFSLPNIKIIDQLIKWDKRIGINCNTPEEIEAIKKFGFNEWNRVVFSGGVLPEKDLMKVALTGCLVNVASTGNMRKLISSTEIARLGLRLDLSNSALKGLRASELNKLMGSNLQRERIESLHAYLGTEIEDVELLIRHAEVLIQLASNCDGIKEINFGGGFYYDYFSRNGDIAKMVDLETYFKTIKTFKDKYLKGRRIRLSWEPGRAIFAGAGYYITKVIEVRENEINSADIYVDGSFTNIPALKFRNRNHLAVVLDNKGYLSEGTHYMANICGATTLSTDKILPNLIAMPEVSPGDFIVVLDSGAYGRAGSYNFLGKAKPPEVLIDNDSWKLIRERQSENHLLEGLC
jgi:diaminopimelate decarboxylase